jgi:hypothetical protein
MPDPSFLFMEAVSSKPLSRSSPGLCSFLGNRAISASYNRIYRELGNTADYGG